MSKYVLTNCPLLQGDTKKETDAEKSIYFDFNKMIFFRVLQLLLLVWLKYCPLELNIAKRWIFKPLPPVSYAFHIIDVSSPALILLLAWGNNFIISFKMHEFVVRTFDALEVQIIEIVLYLNTNLHTIVYFFTCSDSWSVILA